MSKDEEIKEKDTMRKAKIAGAILDVIAVSIALYAQAVSSLKIGMISFAVAVFAAAGYIFLYNRRRQNEK